MCILKQRYLEQLATSMFAPTHFCPPHCGGGLSQERVRHWQVLVLSPPSSWLQGCQDDQWPKPPSCVRFRSFKNQNQRHVFVFRWDFMCLALCASKRWGFQGIRKPCLFIIVPWGISTLGDNRKLVMCNYGRNEVSLENRSDIEHLLS